MAISQTFRAFTPEIWTPKINEELEKNLVAAKIFANYSDDVAAGGDSIWIPDVTSGDMSAQDIATTNGEIDGQSLNDTKTQLSIDNWKGVAYRFSDFQVAQVARQYNLREGYARRMGYKLADTFDQGLLSEYSNITPRVGDSSTAVSATNIENAFKIATSNSVPKNEMSLIIHPKTYWNDIMSIQKYYDASQFGKPSLPQGAHDVLYGVPVYISQNVQTSDSGGATMYMNMLVHGSSIVYALGNLPGGMTTGYKPRMSEKTAESLRTKYIADLMYGVKTLNAKRGVAIRGK